MAEPIRVLHVFGTVNRGGAESRIMDLYRHMDRERIQFDFLIHTREKGHFEDEIRSLGGRVYRIPRFRVVNYGAYRKALKDFFQDHHEFRCVQGHMTSTAALYLPIAKASGVPVTAAHARSAGVDKGVKGLVTRLMRVGISRKADCLFACSRLAGESVFGKRAVRQGRTIYIPNAIEIDRFGFNSQVRDRLRKELELDGRFVIGHVGRFDYAKNHEYLLKIFYEYHVICGQAKLVLLGDGDGQSRIEEAAEKLGIRGEILFLGNQRNIFDYYQIMDYFVFPSRFEGLPGTVIEAQTSGLKCLISDTIADEVCITGLVQVKSIKETPAQWAAVIKQTADYKRMDMTGFIEKSGFDVRKQAQKMAAFYESGDPASIR